MNPELSPNISAADAAAAHEFLVELRTRITTQPLPYQYGTATRALESLWEVFGQARAVMKKHPNCEVFAARVTQMLNVDLRPVTAKWHRAHEEGRLNSRDGSDEFRGDLGRVQQVLRNFAIELHQMAYGKEAADELSPPALTEAELDHCFAPVPFGILHDPDKEAEPTPQASNFAEKIEDINLTEAKEVHKRRAKYGIKTPEGKNAVGLAFSGGGIRSATFSLGVTQVLAARGLLKDVDFLSTVSGGGYTGSALTARIGTGTPIEGFAHPHGPDPGPVGYIRHHAKFLNPLNRRDGWAMFAATLGGLLLNWAAPLFLLLVVALLTVRGSKQGWKADFPAWLIGVSGVTVLVLVIYGGLLRGRERGSQIGSWLLGGALALLVLVPLSWLVNLGYEYFAEVLNRRTLSLPGSLKFAGSLVVSLSALKWVYPLLQKPATRQLALNVLLWIARLILPVLALTVFYVCRYFGETYTDPLATSGPLNYVNGTQMLLLLAVVLGLIAAFVVNVNLTAPHRIYRERLGRTFVQKTDNDAMAVVLAEVNATHCAPYHLINTTLNLPTSQNTKLRDRKCDFFLFSKHWSGSPLVGYFPTSIWKMNGKAVDLTTAMAISGAAASSYMGLGSMPTLSALLTFLNVRLGFWIHRPDKMVLMEAPGFACLMREMLRLRMREEAAWLNLSDGGHIENMAVYELLRRRAKFIICVDGEADPAFTFGGLLTLVRHAQIDLGIGIAPHVNELRPDATTGWSQSHALFCRIDYPARGGEEAATGLLLYLKLSVTGNESELIQRYRRVHPAFPHESTADQFFTEEQFEAYRQLGVHVAEGLFSPALMNNEAAPNTVAGWFRRLAGNLLVPEEVARKGKNGQ